MTPALAATLLENTYNLEGLGLSAPQMQGTTSSEQQNAAADPLAMRPLAMIPLPRPRHRATRVGQRSGPSARPSMAVPGGQGLLRRTSL